MTDNRTTELREKLGERGIEWKAGLDGVTFVGDWCFVEYENGKLAATCEPVLTPEQVIAATLGSGNLTAEQVQKVIYKHGINDGFVYSVLKGSFQAIADELNAELGSGKLTAEQLRDAINELQKKQPYCYDPDKPLDTLKTIGRYIGELESTVLRMYREHPIAQFEQWIEDLGLNEADAWNPRTLGSEREKALEDLVRDLFDRGKYFNPERYGIKALTKRARNLGIEVNL